MILIIESVANGFLVKTELPVVDTEQHVFTDTPEGIGEMFVHLYNSMPDVSVNIDRDNALGTIVAHAAEEDGKV